MNECSVTNGLDNVVDNKTALKKVILFPKML